MRATYADIVEKGRVRSGSFSSEPRSKSGAFFVRCKETGQELKIIVGDGSDWTEAGLSGEPWEHVSVSCERRCPTWTELCFVKSLFWEDEECVIQYHPPRSRYVNNHAFVLHLWKPTQTPIPMPPLQCV